MASPRRRTKGAHVTVQGPVCVTVSDDAASRSLLESFRKGRRTWSFIVNPQSAAGVGVDVFTNTTVRCSSTRPAVTPPFAPRQRAETCERTCQRPPPPKPPRAGRALRARGLGWLRCDRLPRKRELAPRRAACDAKASHPPRLRRCGTREQACFPPFPGESGARPGTRSRRASGGSRSPLSRVEVPPSWRSFVR